MNYSVWFPVSKGSPATYMELKCPHTLPGQAFTMILSVGIRYRTNGADNDVDQLHYAGAAKILVTG